eukprot:5590919-Pleurochrysis_carterae.AAC.1
MAEELLMPESVESPDTIPSAPKGRVPAGVDQQNPLATRQTSNSLPLAEKDVFVALAVPHESVNAFEQQPSVEVIVMEPDNHADSAISVARSEGPVMRGQLPHSLGSSNEAAQSGCSLSNTCICRTQEVGKDKATNHNVEAPSSSQAGNTQAPSLQRDSSAEAGKAGRGEQCGV